MRYINEGQRGRAPFPKGLDPMPERDFDSIYTDYSRLVYWAAYGVLSNKEQTEDVVQEVFITVLKNMEKVSELDDARLKGWLYRVTVNAALDAKRKSGHEVLSDEPLGAEVPDASETPEEEVVASDTAAAVRAAMESIDERYAQVLKLYYFAEMGVAEIASAVNISEGTVKSRLARGRALLYSILKSKGIRL